MRPCWCGETEFATFSADYGKCTNCGTLVSQHSLTDEQLVVKDDETDFYGKQYWLGHQAEDLGFPDIHARARNDLTERNLHWLKALLKYRLPAASVIELGCAHGSFVALMTQAGYAASGVEMSAWVVAFGKHTFEIPVAIGPIENLEIAPGSQDVIALMDVLEHLPDPIATMRHCLELLKPDGVLLIQTPRFETDMRYQVLLDTDSPFIEQLKVDEHLYLFTIDSVQRLFAQLGAPYVAFEPAIFSQYDMFLAVGRQPLVIHPTAERDAALMATPNGRVALALLDLRERELALVARLAEADADRTARGEQVATLTTLLGTTSQDSDARGQQIRELTELLAVSEADRATRHGDVIELSAAVGTLEADRVAHVQQIETLSALLRDAEADRANLHRDIVALTTLARAGETDRAARGEQIEALTIALRASEGDRLARAEQIEELTRLLNISEVDRAARADQIAVLTSALVETQGDRDARGIQLTTLTALLSESEADRGARGKQIDTLTAMVVASQQSDDVLVADLRTLLSRPEFRAPAAASEWPEVKSLANLMGIVSDQVA